ncbi:GNAT family N-acetyltransferase [Luteolibacter arcticus]|uniref:GNAT family N-acetyltransferase n=1 Tax=Luteolibacter arcticus TaxID=1581411 RepID=A0ABT3GSU6_9BACT|nr:GNAT family N-acetyltransferase [Luteolibacter arcticus]MCW1926557.1 GNAT family N-acetyltransferase [Luteolibacter arcticus]
MDLRLLHPADALAYRQLRLQALRESPPAFGTPPEEEENLPLDHFARRLEPTADRRFLGAFEEETGLLIGSLRLSRYDGSNESHKAYLAGLYVHPAHRGRGHGRALIGHALALAKSDPSLRRLNLTVVSGQQAARALYLSAGFTESGIEWEAFEHHGSYYDEILMTCDLRASHPPGRPRDPG